MHICNDAGQAGTTGHCSCLLCSMTEQPASMRVARRAKWGNKEMTTSFPSTLFSKQLLELTLHTEHTTPYCQC